MTAIRIRWKRLGGHYHCRFFTARKKGWTYAKNGDLVFDEKEWEDVKEMIDAEFLEEEESER